MSIRNGVFPISIAVALCISVGCDDGDSDWEADSGVADGSTDTDTDSDTDSDGDTDTDGGADAGCQSSAECDEVNSTKGWLCVDGECAPCAEDDQCMADPYYGDWDVCVAGMCTYDCPNHVVGCPCDDGVCTAGLVCDEATQLCREPWTCADIECAQHQLCAEGSGGGEGDAGPDAGQDGGPEDAQDAYCLPECEDYWTWNWADGVCDPILNCEEGAPNSIADDCQDQNRICYEAEDTAQCGDCLEGFYDEGGECLVASNCLEDDPDSILDQCTDENRECVEADGTAECGDCLAGYLEVDDPLNEGEQICKAQTCEAGDEASIRTECIQQHRICEENGDDPAACGDCWAWYLEENDECRAVVDCADLGCAEAHRTCTDAELHLDAECGDCLPGYEDEFGTCVPASGTSCDGDTAVDISDDCAELHRGCVEISENEAECGDCLYPDPEDDKLYVEDPATGECVREYVCECPEDNPSCTNAIASTCLSQNRICEMTPLASCTSCIADYIEDYVSGECRPAITCDDIADNCALLGMDCQPHNETEDAYCRPDCSNDQIWAGDHCADCPVCGAGDVICEGEFCYYENGETGDAWPQATIDGRCICETAPGFFYNVAGDMSAYPCDADGDGWLRESARIAMDSEDPAILANARCERREVDRFVLEAVAASTYHAVNDCPFPSADDCDVPDYLARTIQLEDAVELYETDRNDDQQLLELDTVKAPVYGAYGRQPRASELNRLTKLCAEGADYNDNLVDDIEEWDYRQLPSGYPIHLAAFNWFSYFAELHRGWYEPPTAEEQYGSYHIREKSRSSAAPVGERISVERDWANEDEQAFYESCPLNPDPSFCDDGNPTIGRDFARWGPSEPRWGYALTWPPGETVEWTWSDVDSEWVATASGWDGMNLHSQFKCVDVVEEGNPDLHPTLNPHLVTPDQVNGAGHAMNTCRIKAGGTDSSDPIGEDDVNPYDPILLCEAEDSAEVGDIGWISKAYQLYEQDEGYAGGCVNQVVASRSRCGVCGLGNWTCGGFPLGPDGGAGAWLCGDYDEPDGCDDIDLSPLPMEWIETFDCDDAAYEEYGDAPDGWLSTSAFVFVDGATGDDLDPGSRDLPKRTIGAALEAAGWRNSHYFTQRVFGVVIAAGDYDEKALLHYPVNQGEVDEFNALAGVSLLGGYSAEQDGDGRLYWVRRDGALTRIVSASDDPRIEEGPKRIVGIEARDIPADYPTLIDRVVIDLATPDILPEPTTDPDEDPEGWAAYYRRFAVGLYGVFADSAPGLHLRDVTIAAGTGTTGHEGGENDPGEDGFRQGGAEPGEPSQNNQCLYSAVTTRGGQGGPYDLLGHGLDGEPNIGGSQNGEAECAAAGECSTTWECSGTLAAACGSGTTGCPTDHGFWDEWCGCLHDETCTVFDQANAGSAGTPGDGGLAAYSFVDEDTGFWMGGEHLVETVQIGEEWIDLAVTDGRPGEPGEGGGGGPGITVVVDSGGSLYNVVVQGGGGGAGGCGGGGGKGGETGGSSFALYALGSSGMVAENVALTAGDGADGGNGGTSGDQGQGGPGGEPECPTGATTCTPGETLDTIAGGEGGPGGYGGHGAGGNGGVSCALFSDDDLDLAGGAALSSGSHGIAGAGVEDTPPAGDTGWGYAGQTTLDNAGVYCQ